MQISPLQLKRYFLTEVSVKSNLDYNQERDGDEPVLINSQVSRGANSENPRDWKIDLKLSVLKKDGKQSPYSVQIAATGYFEVLPQVPEELIERIAGANGPAVLYGAMREIVAQITSRGPHDALLLPSVTFIDEKPVNQKPLVKAAAKLRHGAKVR